MNDSKYKPKSRRFMHRIGYASMILSLILSGIYWLSLSSDIPTIERAIISIRPLFITGLIFGLTFAIWDVCDFYAKREADKLQLHEELLKRFGDRLSKTLNPENDE